MAAQKPISFFLRLCYDIAIYWFCGSFKVIIKQHPARGPTAGAARAGQTENFPVKRWHGNELRLPYVTQRQGEGMSERRGRKEHVAQFRALGKRQIQKLARIFMLHAVLHIKEVMPFYLSNYRT